MPIYKCFYSDTPLINEFNEIETFIVFEFISSEFGRFNVIKKTIKKSFLNKYIIRIVIKRAIYIGFVKPDFKIII